MRLHSTDFNYVTRYRYKYNLKEWHFRPIWGNYAIFLLHSNWRHSIASAGLNMEESTASCKQSSNDERHSSYSNKQNKDDHIIYPSSANELKWSLMYQRRIELLAATSIRFDLIYATPWPTVRPLRFHTQYWLRCIHTLLNPLISLLRNERE
jgi:hypothetical protein